MAEVSEETEYTAILRRVLTTGGGAGQARRAQRIVFAGQEAGFRAPGDAIVLLGTVADTGNPAAGEEIAVVACLRDAVAKDMLSSVYDRDHTSLAVCAAAECIAGGIGALLSIDVLEAEGEPGSILFGTTKAQALVSLPKERLNDLDALAVRHGVVARCLGMVGGNRLMFTNCHRVLIDALLAGLHPFVPREES